MTYVVIVLACVPEALSASHMLKIDVYQFIIIVTANPLGMGYLQHLEVNIQLPSILAAHVLEPLPYHFKRIATHAYHHLMHMQRALRVAFHGGLD